MSSNGGDRKEDDLKEVEQKMMHILERWMTETTSDGGVDGGIQPTGEQLADTSTTLEAFSGDGESLSVAEWVDRLMVAKEIGVWSEAKTRCVLLRKLTGPARAWHIRRGATLPTFDEWRTKFVDEFSPQYRMRQLVKDLNSRIQRGSEPLQMYIWRSAAVAAQLGMSPADAKGQILHGLQPDYQFLVHELSERAHDSIPDLLNDITKTIEFHRSLIGLMRNTVYRIRLRWLPMSRGNRPRKAVKGGTDTSGEELFVIRALQKEELTPGKLAPSHSAAYVPFHGRECAHRDYEVLVADCNLEWVKCGSDSEKLPPGSIQGGYTKDGEPLYIGRAQHRDSVTCGKVRWSSKTCYLSWGGQEHLYQTFEVLTYQTIDLD